MNETNAPAPTEWVGAGALVLGRHYVVTRMTKPQLWAQVRALVAGRAQTAQEAMQAAQASANEEGKSSAGDKYETARAMGQLDRDMFARQYDQARQELAILDRIDPNVVAPAGAPVALGSLVQTSVGWFWLAVSAGNVVIGNETVTVVSPRSPVGAALLGNQRGNRVALPGGRQAVIESVR